MSRSSVTWSRSCAALGFLAFAFATGAARAATSPWSGTPVALPGTIQAEDFDRGGQGATFRDMDAANTGGRYRPKEAVDIVSSPEAGGGYVVNHFETGEWMVYTVNVPTAGNYDFEMRAAAAAPGSSYHIDVDGAPVTEVVGVPATGNWNTFEWVGKRRAWLAAGNHTLTVTSDQQYFNFDAIRVTAASAPTQRAAMPFFGTPTVVPATIEAENYDWGGQGTAYYDNTAGNTGGHYRTQDVDVMASPDPAGGYFVSHFEAGEWVLYTIEVPTTGSYDIDLRAGTAMDNSAFHLRVDWQPVTSRTVLPNMGTWNAYQWVGRQRVTLTAGTHTLMVVSDQPYFSLDAIRINAATTTTTTAVTSSFSSARMLFGSGFEGTVDVAPPTECWGTGCWQDLLGADAVTGYSWPAKVWDGTGKLLILTDPLYTTPWNVGEYAFNRIERNSSRNGKGALYQQITQAMNGTAPQGNGSTQNELQFLPKYETGDTYVSYWVRLQPDLVEKMNNLPAGPGISGGGTWRAFFEFKTGNQTPWGGPANDGDYRVAVNILTYGGGQPYWHMRGDNVAGGNAPLVNSWTDDNRNVPVPVGTWFKFEIFWHRSSGSDGRVWAAVNGQPLFDHRGANVGAWNLPINRIMAPVLYSGSAMPVYQWVDDVEVWDGFPPANGSNPPYAMH
jgi:hypothetical protein